MSLGMPTIDVTENDLVIVVPNDSASGGARTKVFVGNRPIGLLQRVNLNVGMDFPATLTVEFPSDSAMQVLSPRLNLSLVAYQALLDPWLNPVRGSSPATGATLWQRLNDEED